MIEVLRDTNFTRVLVRFNDSLSKDIDHIIGKKPHIELITNNFLLRVLSDIFSHFY